MKVGDKEFCELISQFEKDIYDMPFYVSSLKRADRSDGIPKNVFYDNGETNNIFQAYMAGYEFAKCLARS